MNQIKLGMTGSRYGMTWKQKNEFHKWLLEAPFIIEAHHGDCVGADSEFHDIMLENNIPIIIHPPIDTKFRANNIRAISMQDPKPYLERNHGIVDLTDFIVAFPATTSEQLRSGTWATIRYAQKHKIPHKIFLP